MGIKIRKFVYVSDRGDQYELDEMEPSHLINAIAHHQKQHDALVRVMDKYGLTTSNNLCIRLEDLDRTVHELVSELMTRFPGEDHE